MQRWVFGERNSTEVGTAVGADGDVGSRELVQEFLPSEPMNLGGVVKTVRVHSGGCVTSGQQKIVGRFPLGVRVP